MTDGSTNVRTMSVSSSRPTPMVAPIWAMLSTAAREREHGDAEHDSRRGHHTACVAAHRPDVVVMDLRMKRVDGIEATGHLSARGGPPVLALTTFHEDELLSGAW